MIQKIVVTPNGVEWNELVEARLEHIDNDSIIKLIFFFVDDRTQRAFGE